MGGGDAGVAGMVAIGGAAGMALHFLDRAFLHFDLGTSSDRLLSFQPVAPLLRHSFPADLSLVAGGLMLATTIIGRLADSLSGFANRPNLQM